MREKNIGLVTGLIQKYFVKADVAELGMGAALAVDFENSLRLSRFERNRYELKVGRADIAKGTKPAAEFYDKLFATICGIANCGPEADGYVYFGVADKKSAADRVREVFGGEPIEVAGHYFCGVEHELADQGIDISEYVRQIIRVLETSALSEPLRTNVASQITHGVYRGKTFVRVRIPAQKQLSDVGGRYYVRKESETKEMTTTEALAQAKLFD